MIVAAALRNPADGEIITLPKPARHIDLLRASGTIDWHGTTKWRAWLWDQGFIDADGEFRDRATAARIAHECGQVDNPLRSLHSEDLW